MEGSVLLSLIQRKLTQLGEVQKRNQLQLGSVSSKLDQLKKCNELFMKAVYLKKQEALILIDIVNKGLEFTYPDKLLVFDMKFEEKHNRVVPEFYLNDEILKAPFVGKAGGIISVIGMLIYITFIKLRNTKIILLDEIESMVDIGATHNLFQFLQYFAEQNEMIISVVTHKIIEDDNAIIIE